MNDKQYAQFASFAKSDDFLDDNATPVSAVTQFPPQAVLLKAKLAEIVTADGIGSADNRGEAINKGNLRKELEAKMLLVSRAATAYYLSIDNPIKQKNVDFNVSEIERMMAEKLFSTAKKLVSDTTPDAANLIGADASDVSALDSAADAYNDVIPDTKRATERSKIYNAIIDPVLAECRNIRSKIDIYMQTFIASEPLLYAEWRETLHIDDGPSSNPPILSLQVDVESGQMRSIDYSDISLFNTTEIKLLNPNEATIDFGFGPDDTSFAGTPTTVNEQSNSRKSALSLGYHSVDSPVLLVRNESGVILSITLEFYDMN